MDLNDYWQENKRFVTSVALGVFVFSSAVLVRDSVFEQDIASTRRRIASLKRELGEPLFNAADQQRAADQNAALSAASEALVPAVSFVTRPAFRVDAAGGSPSNQYLRALTRVREDLLPRANRANLIVDAGLGMPKLSPTRDEEIIRYLEALDTIDVTLENAIQAGVARVDGIKVRLDKGLRTRAGLGRVEQTRVTFKLSGSSLALTRVLVATQRPPDGRTFLIEQVELLPARGRNSAELRLEMTLLIARLRPEAEV